jgi:hypothetical protein
VQFVGLPSRTLYVIALVAWFAVTAAIFHPKAEQLLARRVWRLRPPSALEAQRLGAAWFAVCAAARVDPNRYRVWIHEGPEGHRAGCGRLDSGGDELGDVHAAAAPP